MFNLVNMCKFEIVFLTKFRWFDGISTFYVGKDGLIHKHKADRVNTSGISNEVTRFESFA